MHHKYPIIHALALVGFIMPNPIAIVAGQTGQSSALAYDRPHGNPYQSRSVVVAKQGIVATSHPLASQAGLDVLKAGGTAADAAIAANAMLGLVEPMSCGIGGDLFVIYWEAKTQKLYGLNASGRSPYKLSRKIFADLGHEQIPTVGPLSWSVPGCVSGWEELRQEFGRKDLLTIQSARRVMQIKGSTTNSYTACLCCYWWRWRSRSAIVLRAIARHFHHR